MRKKLCQVLLVLSGLVLNASATSAQALGTAQDFAILSGTAVTCTTSSVTGNVGVWPGDVVTGCTITGSTHKADAVAQKGFMDFVAAYNNLRDHPPACDSAHTLTGTLANESLLPGVWCVDAVAKTGTLFLDGQNNPNASWLFLVKGALTGTDFTVKMLQQGNPCNVVWWTSAASTMTTSKFIGTVLSGAAITVTGVGTFNGNALAMAGVTLTDTVLTGCAKVKVRGVKSPPMKCDIDDDNGHDGNDDDDHDYGDNDHDKNHNYNDKNHNYNDKNRKDNDNKGKNDYNKGKK